MSMPVIQVATFPDSEALIMRVIRDAGIVLNGAPLFVASSWPGKEKLPVGLVQRWGGVPAMIEWVDLPRIQMECWGRNKAEAYDGLEAMRVAVTEMRGQVYDFGGGDVKNAVVNDVRVDLGITWQPDTVTHTDRYIIGMALTLHPLPV